MSVNIPDHFVTQYTTNVAHLLQANGGKLRSKVTEGAYSGESGAVVDQYGTVEALEVTSQFAPMPRMDVSFSRRWVYPTDYEISQMVDSFDKLRLITDPMSAYPQVGANGMARKIDKLLFGSFFADAKTGKNGGTTETFDDTNHRVVAAIGASAATGLNVDKILRGKRIMEMANVNLEEEELFMAITPIQHEDLLRQTQVINTEYFNKAGAPVMVDGRVTSFAGVNIVVSTLVDMDAAGTYRVNPMWVKSGMHLGIWKDVSSRVDTRPDLSGVPWQLYNTMTMGATRVEPGRVVKIENLEA